jgi:hypothetical protein
VGDRGHCSRVCWRLLLPAVAAVPAVHAGVAAGACVCVCACAGWVVALLLLHAAWVETPGRLPTRPSECVPCCCVLRRVLAVC